MDNSQNTNTSNNEQNIKKNNINLIISIVIGVVVVVVIIIVAFVISSNKNSSNNNSNTSSSTTPVATSVLNNLGGIYSNSTAGISFYYPQDWVKTDNTNGVLVQVVSPTIVGNVKPNFNVIETDSKIYASSINTQMDSVVNSFQQQLTNFALISKSDININGAIKAVKITFTWTTNGQDIQQEQILAIANDKYYQLTFTAGKDTWSSSDDIRTQIYNSVLIK